VDIPEADGPVVAFAQVIECFCGQCGVSPGTGGLDGCMRVAQDGDDITGPVLDAAGTEFRDRPAPPDHVCAALLDAGQGGEKVLVARVAVGDEVAGERGRQPGGDGRLAA